MFERHELKNAEEMIGSAAFLLCEIAEFVKCLRHLSDIVAFVDKRHKQYSFSHLLHFSFFCKLFKVISAVFPFPLILFRVLRIFCVSLCA